MLPRYFKMPRLNGCITPSYQTVGKAALRGLKILCADVAGRSRGRD